MPSISGMLMSRKTTSGSRLRTMATASRPLPAWPTIESSGQASFRRSTICSRIRRSSSATTAVGEGRVRVLIRSRRGDFVRYFDGGAGAARGRNADDQLGAAVVQGFQALSDVGEPHAAGGIRLEAYTAVEHVHRQLPIDDFGSDLQPAALGLRLEAMLDGVLHQRLQR